MTTWNYRVIRKRYPAVGPVKAGEGYDIREVYYDDDGKIEATTVEPCYPAGESLEELIADVARFAEATNKPVLDMDDDFPPDRKPGD